MKILKIFSLIVFVFAMSMLAGVKAQDSSWKAYEDTDFNFSVSYPFGLMADLRISTEFQKDNTKLIKDIRFTNEKNIPIFTATIFENPEGLPINEWVDKYNTNTNDKGALASLGNIKGVIYRINAQGNPAPNFYFEQDSKIFVLSSLQYDEEFEKFVTSYNIPSLVSYWERMLSFNNKAYAFGPYVLPFYANLNITCGFGCYSGHTGVDYNASNRTSVAAASGGQLWNYYYAGPSNYGNLVAIKHTNGYRSRYAHLDSSIKSNGTNVSQGEHIAYSGNSGGPWCQETDVQGNCIRWDSPYHLHFETRINAGDGDYLAGTAVDPYSSSNYLWTTNPPSLATPYKTTTIGQFDPNQAIWYLRYTNTTGSADNTFAYGNSNWTPITGDWNNDKITTIGLVNPNNMTFYLRNENSTGGANITFQYGNIGWIPITGDWDGNGTTTIGLVDPSTMTFYLRNQNSAGGADITFQYGNIGWTPITGDWDKNGTTTIGLFDPNQAYWYLRNENSTGGANITFQYGNSGWISVTGDWNADGYTTIGLFDSSTGIWYLRNTNDAGAAHLTFSYGNSGWKPVTGAWQ